MRYENKLDLLHELVERDHGGCDELGCSIARAQRQDLWLVAIEAFAASGAACDQFYKYYNALPRKRFESDLFRQIKLLKDDEGAV